MTTATITAPVKARRVALPGEVNITKNQAARDAIEALRAQKKAESAGAKAKRERKGKGGSEEVLRAVMTSDDTVLVINGQPVAKYSSERHLPVTDLAKLETLFPEAYAACVTTITWRNIEL